MKHIKKTQFRDNQILMVISKLKRCTILNIFEYCVDNYSLFSWNYHNIRNSIKRLYNDDKIKLDEIKEDVDYNYNGKVYKQERTINYYSIKGDKNEFPK